jgi:hypothetical protein
MNGNEEDRLGGLTSLARERLPPPAGGAESAEAYARFRYGLATRTDRRRRRARAAWLVASGSAALAAVVVVLLAVLRPAATPAPALTVHVEGGTVDEGGYVRAIPAAIPAGNQADIEPSLRFSDGTQVDLAPAARVRVAETDERGARVLLEEGRARAHVVPRTGSRWVFDAGPCRVQVTGTRFDMRWSPADQVLEVALYSGSVIVKGPPAVGGVPMRAGQRLVMDVRGGSVRFGDLSAPAETPPAPPAPSAPGPAAAAPPPLPRAPTRAPAPTVRRAEAWPARVLAGEFRSVVDEAGRRGVDDVLRHESDRNLMALADAARYAGAAPLAERALMQVRARFPESSSAHRAAFLLGRMAEDQDRDLGKALDWYRIFLADAGGDPRADAFRAEALGRQMTATLRLHGVAQARPLAAEYLRRYPRGAYAKAAHTIAGP